MKEKKINLPEHLLRPFAYIAQSDDDDVAQRFIDKVEEAGFSICITVSSRQLTPV